MNLTKLLLIGGAGYLAYEYFLKPAEVDAAPAIAAAGIVPAATTPASAANATTTQALVKAAAAAGGFTSGNVDQWNYFYAQARGIPAPAPDTWGVTDSNRAQVLTFDEWWDLASSHGLSGVIPTGRPMMQPARGVGYIPTKRLMVMEME